MAISIVLFILSSLCVLGLGGAEFLRWKKKKRKMDQEQLAQAIREKKEMEHLISSPGWKTLKAIGMTQASIRENQVLLKPTVNPLEQEYQKGEIQGIKLFLQYPETVFENAKAIIESQRQDGNEIEED